MRRHDAHPTLRAGIAETKLGCRKQTIDNHVVAAHPIVHELGRLSLGTDDEERRQFALGDAAREFDVNLLAVIEARATGARWVVALDRVSGSAMR